jgi:signal transduction histidine kinase/DNA-binding response OmpR family regulator
MKRILAVDDLEENLYLLRVLLEAQGYTVELARNGAEALEKARADPPDLVVSDILMPVMDGFTLCRQWRADPCLAPLPFVFYTATYTDPRDEKLALDIGADVFLTKPAEPAEILGVVAGLLARSGAERPACAPGPTEDDEGVLKQYSQALVRKLEDKMLQLEQEVAERRLAEQTLQRQLAFDDLIEGLLASIACATAPELDGRITAVLQPVGESLGVESVMVLQVSEDQTTWGTSYSWAVPGVSSVADNLKQLPVGTLPWIETELLSGRTVLLRSAEELPPEASDVRALWEQQGLKSALLVPLRGRGSVVQGCLALFSVGGRVGWDKQELHQAGQMAEAIANTLERKRTEDHLRENEAQLRQSHKMEAMGQMAGGIAHDFNNLLTAIIGYSDLILSDAESNPAGEASPYSEILGDVREIRMAAQRAGELTRQILAFSRRQTLRPEAVVLNEAVAETKPLLERALGEDIELVFDLSDRLGTCEVDRHQLVSVLVNLTLNARDAMPHGGKLTIESANVDLDDDYCRHHADSIPGAYVMLAVSDTGMGMTRELQTRIFEPFYTTKQAGQGTGLGLSMVYGIVKQSGGNIYVYSEVDKGSSFKVYLPRVGPAETAGPEATELECSGEGPQTILVVEDEEALRVLIKRVLEPRGYHVCVVNDGDSALEMLQTNGWQTNLLVTDLVLPGALQGRQLAERAAELRPGLPVLFMSGYTRGSAVRGEAIDDAMAFLEKPFTADGLAAKVREMLASAGGLGGSQEG